LLKRIGDIKAKSFGTLRNVFESKKSKRGGKHIS